MTDSGVPEDDTSEAWRPLLGRLLQRLTERELNSGLVDACAPNLWPDSLDWQSGTSAPTAPQFARVAWLAGLEVRFVLQGRVSEVVIGSVPQLEPSRVAAEAARITQALVRALGPKTAQMTLSEVIEHAARNGVRLTVRARVPARLAAGGSARGRGLPRISSPAAPRPGGLGV